MVYTGADGSGSGSMELLSHALSVNAIDTINSGKRDVFMLIYRLNLFKAPYRQPHEDVYSLPRHYKLFGSRIRPRR